MSWLLNLAALVAQPVAIDHSYDRYLQPARMVEIAPSRRLNLRCEGDGDGPTILLEAGLGFPGLSWRDVQPRLAGVARTWAYDRAGLAFSDPGPMPRIASAIVDDLEALIDRGELQPPFILVGNSMGGQVVRLFAFRRPHQVTGLILLDPYVEGQYPRLAAIDPSIATELAELAHEETQCVDDLRHRRISAEEAEQRDCIAGPGSGFSPALVGLLRRQRMSPAGFEAARSESLMLDGRNEAELAAARRPLGGIPVIVLSAARNFSGSRFDRTRAALLAEQRRLHQSLADLSDVGEVVTIDAGHVIQTSNPDAVIAAVRRILARPGR